MVLLAVLMSAGLLVLSAGLPPDLREGSNDLSLYRQAGESILRGEVPYRNFFIEYPPGSLPAFIPPALFSESQASFIDLFALEMALVLAVTLLLAALGARRLRGSRAWILPAATFAIAAVLLYPVAVTRYDAVVALTLGLAVFFAALGGRYLSLAYVSLGLGAAAKLVPALALLPLALTRREAMRGCAVFLTVVALTFVPFALLGNQGLLQSFAYQAERGLQVESLAASVLMFFRSGDSIVFEHGAFEVRGEGVGLATSLSPVLTLLLLAVTGLAMWWEYRRCGGLGVGAFPRHAAALILAFMLGSRVLSPQYMIWLLPLVPLSAGGFVGVIICALFLAACFTTTLVFPVHYADLLSFRYPGPELLLARNLLLVILWITMLALATVGAEKRSS
jgi:Glycosyltransferase family 87